MIINKFEIKTPSYASNAALPVGEIFTPQLIELLKELYLIAAVNMGSTIDTTMISREVDVLADMLKRDFTRLPLHRVCEAFYHGSLGGYGGTTRLTIRNIAIWLREADTRHQQQLDQHTKLTKDQEKRGRGYAHGAAAVMLKISWKTAGLINIADWDKYDLQKIFNLLEQGLKSSDIKPKDVRV
jgi:hypothetical protein